MQNREAIAAWMAEEADWYGIHCPLDTVDAEMAEDALRKFIPMPHVNAFTDPSVGQYELEALAKMSRKALKAAGFTVVEAEWRTRKDDE